MAQSISRSSAGLVKRQGKLLTPRRYIFGKCEKRNFHHNPFSQEKFSFIWIHQKVLFFFFFFISNALHASITYHKNFQPAASENLHQVKFISIQEAQFVSIYPFFLKLIYAALVVHYGILSTPKRLHPKTFPHIMRMRQFSVIRKYEKSKSENHIHTSYCLHTINTRDRESLPHFAFITLSIHFMFSY